MIFLTDVSEIRKLLLAGGGAFPHHYSLFKAELTKCPVHSNRASWEMLFVPVKKLDENRKKIVSVKMFLQTFCFYWEGKGGI